MPAHGAGEKVAPAVLKTPGGVVKPFGRFDVSTLHHREGGFPLDPQSEVNELRDIGAADCTPTLGSAVTWDVVDRMWAAEMERRERAAASPTGYRDAACEACGCALYVPVGQGRDLLCPQCQHQGEELAAADDDGGGGPRPPAAGAMHPDYPQFATLACRLLDDELCEAIGAADAEPTVFRLHSPARRDAFICAMSAEVVRRLDGRRAA